MDDDIHIDFEPLPLSPRRQAEAGGIVAAAAVKSQFGEAWVNATAEFQGENIPLPKRSESRPIDL